MYSSIVATSALCCVKQVAIQQNLVKKCFWPYSNGNPRVEIQETTTDQVLKGKINSPDNMDCTFLTVNTQNGASSHTNNFLSFAE